MSDKKLIHVIGDYGTGDLAFEEVNLSIRKERRHIDDTIEKISVPPFDTYATGFMLAQLAINSQLGSQHKFFVNTAPRKDDGKARANNAGEGLVYARLYNGVEICAVNSRHTLSYIKEAAEEICVVQCAVDGSQFRSRDVFPAAFAEILKGNREILGRTIEKDEIADMPSSVVLYTDGYGNLKTSIPDSYLSTEFRKNNPKVEIAIGRNKTAHVSEGMFGVKEGELCLSIGSSGWRLQDGTRMSFLQVAERGGSAARQFNKPRGGAEVVIRQFTPDQ